MGLLAEFVCVEAVFGLLCVVAVVVLCVVVSVVLVCVCFVLRCCVCCVWFCVVLFCLLRLYCYVSVRFGVCGGGVWCGVV